MDTSFIKIDQGIQILQLKNDQKFLLISLLFSECLHLYPKKTHNNKVPPFDVLHHKYKQEQTQGKPSWCGEQGRWTQTGVRKLQK